MREGVERSESRCIPGADMQTHGELHIHIALPLPPFRVRRERNIVNISVQSSQGGGTSIGESAWKSDDEAYHMSNCLEVCVVLGHLKALNDDRVGMKSSLDIVRTSETFPLNCSCSQEWVICRGKQVSHEITSGIRSGSHVPTVDGTNKGARTRIGIS